MGYYLTDNFSAPSCTPRIDYGAFRLKDLAQDLSGSLQGTGPALHRAEGSGAGGVGGLIAWGMRT